MAKMPPNSDTETGAPTEQAALGEDQIALPPEADPVLDKLDRLVTQQQLRSFQPRWDNQPPEVPPILTMQDEPMLTTGNTSLLLAAPGTGKSTVCGAIVSAALGGHPAANPNADNFGLAVDLPEDRPMVGYFDTERTPRDTHKGWRVAMKRAGLGRQHDPSDFVAWHCIKGMQEVDMRLDFIEQALYHQPIGLLVIDGLGHLVHDPNDAAEASRIFSWTEYLAYTYNLGVLVTLHPNPRDNKARGHLGSQFMRNAEAVLIIQKDYATGIRTLTTEFEYGKVRNASDRVQSSFMWNDEYGYFTSCTPPSANQRNATEVQKLRELKSIFKQMPPGGFTHRQLCDALLKHRSQLSSLSAAKNYLRRSLLEKDLVVKNASGLYELNLPG